MAVSNVELIVDAVKAVNPLRRTDAVAKKLEGTMARVKSAIQDLSGVATKAGRKMTATFDQAKKSAKRFTDEMTSAKGAIAAIGIVGLTKSVVSQAAQFEQTKIRLNALSKEYGEFDNIQKLIASNAKTFNQSQAESANNFSDVYARLRPLGISLDEIQTVYKGFNATALASGTSAQAASAAFLQLSQALGSGRLQGDEFRSVAEQVPGILRLVASEMNVTVGELKKLGSDGKITSDVLINALAKGFEENKDKIQEILALSPAAKFKKFQNALSELSVTVGNELLPVLIPMVEEATNLLKVFGDLPEPARKVTIGIGAIGAAAVIAVPAVVNLGKALKTIAASQTVAVLA